MMSALFLWSILDQVLGSSAMAIKKRGYQAMYDKVVELMNGDIAKLNNLYGIYQREGNNLEAALAISNPFSSATKKLKDARDKNLANQKIVSEELNRVESEGRTALEKINNASMNAGTGSSIGDLLSGGATTDLTNIYRSTKL